MCIFIFVKLLAYPEKAMTIYFQILYMVVVTGTYGTTNDDRVAIVLRTSEVSTYSFIGIQKMK